MRGGFSLDMPGCLTAQKGSKTALADDFSGVSIEPSSGKTWRPLHALTWSLLQRRRRHRSYLLTDGREDEDQASAARWSNIETAINPPMSVPPGSPPSAGGKCCTQQPSKTVPSAGAQPLVAAMPMVMEAATSEECIPPQPLTTGLRK